MTVSVHWKFWQASRDESRPQVHDSRDESQVTLNWSSTIRNMPCDWEHSRRLEFFALDATWVMTVSVHWKLWQDSRDESRPQTQVTDTNGLLKKNHYVDSTPLQPLPLNFTKLNTLYISSEFVAESYPTPLCHDAMMSMEESLFVPSNFSDWHMLNSNFVEFNIQTSGNWPASSCDGFALLRSHANSPRRSVKCLSPGTCKQPMHASIYVLKTGL